MHGPNRLASEPRCSRPGLLPTDRRGAPRAASPATRPPRTAGSWLVPGWRPARAAGADDLPGRRHRHADGLADAVGLLDKLAGLEADVVDQDSWETTNLVTLATALAGAAALREETRGSHWREDFPERDDARFAGHVDATATGATSGSTSSRPRHETVPDDRVRRHEPTGGLVRRPGEPRRPVWTPGRARAGGPCARRGPAAGDVTSEATSVAPDARGSGVFAAREAGVVAGLRSLRSSSTRSWATPCRFRPGARRHPGGADVCRDAGVRSRPVACCPPPGGTARVQLRQPPSPGSPPRPLAVGWRALASARAPVLDAARPLPDFRALQRRVRRAAAVAVGSTAYGLSDRAMVRDNRVKSPPEGSCRRTSRGPHRPSRLPGGRGRVTPTLDRLPELARGRVRRIANRQTWTPRTVAGPCPSTAGAPPLSEAIGRAGPGAGARSRGRPASTSYLGRGGAHHAGEESSTSVWTLLGGLEPATLLAQLDVGSSRTILGETASPAAR